MLFAGFCTSQFKTVGVFSHLLTLDGMFPGSVISTKNSK